MEKPFLIAVMVCVGFATAARAQNAQDQSVESKVTTLERLLRVQAMSSKDLHTVEILLHREFVMVSEKGAARNRDEALLYLRSIYVLRSTTEQIMVRVHGDTAVATGLFQMVGVQDGKTFVRRGRFLDTWLIRDGTWLLTASISIPAS